MKKRNGLLMTAMTLVLVAAAVAPASAWFEGANGTSGTFASGTFTLSDEGASLTCEKAEGGWVIQDENPSKQAPTKQGPHWDLAFSKSNGCTAFGFVGAEVEGPEVQTLQMSKHQVSGLRALWRRFSRWIARGNCELKIEPASNQNLKTITIANSGTSLEATVNIAGITTTATSLGGLGCVGVKNPTNSAGTLKGTITGVAVKEV
jgi:hypothetical protein